MKTTALLIMLSIVLSCNANKNLAKDSALSNTVSICPDDGECTFEVFKNKNFIIKADEFGNRYSELIDGNKTVLKFKYEKNTMPNVEDDNYSEIIYIEIDDKTPTLKLQDKALESVKAGFSRVCFCRGQMGTFPITVGSLNLIKLADGSYQLAFDFTISEVPQIIKSINETFIL